MPEYFSLRLFRIILHLYLCIIAQEIDKLSCPKERFILEGGLLSPPTTGVNVCQPSSQSLALLYIYYPIIYKPFY